MREKKKGNKHTHRVDHHAFAVRDEGRGHLCSRARSDVYAVHVKLRAATTHTTSARVFAAAPCFPPCVACRCWLFLSRHGRHGSHAKTKKKGSGIERGSYNERPKLEANEPKIRGASGAAYRMALRSAPRCATPVGLHRLSSSRLVSSRRRSSLFAPFRPSSFYRVSR